jgi:hypothetical protein
LSSTSAADQRALGGSPRGRPAAAEQDEDRPHEPEDGTRGADGDGERAGAEDPWPLQGARTEGRGDDEPRQADDAEAPRRPSRWRRGRGTSPTHDRLEHLAEAPQEEAVEGEVDEAAVEEGARDETPPLAEPDERPGRARRSGVDGAGRAQQRDPDDHEDERRVAGGSGADRPRRRTGGPIARSRRTGSRRVPR